MVLAAGGGRTGIPEESKSVRHHGSAEGNGRLPVPTIGNAYDRFRSSDVKGTPMTLPWNLTGPATAALLTLLFLLGSPAAGATATATRPAVGVASDGPTPANRPAAPRIYRDRVEPHWLPAGKRFWYRNEL